MEKNAQMKLRLDSLFRCILSSYLQRSFSVWLLPAQIKLPQYGQTNKEPVAEAVVVDESEHVLHTQVYQGHDPLQGHNRGIVGQKLALIRPLEDRK